jgi:alpha-glucosidase
LSFFSKWRAVKGIKVDFFERNDQIANTYYEIIAESAAKYKFFVDFHGCYIPTGLSRTFPNILNWEAVRGLEVNKWSHDCTPEHDVILAFTRSLAGPVDYTPGAMSNAARGMHTTVFSKPMSMGTRCHQLGLYMIYDAPLQMLADAPDSYRNAGKETLEFFSYVPTTWDETIVLDAKLADYVIKARKKGDEWYIGGITDWSQRTIDLDLHFLEKGEYHAQIFTDGINSDKFGEDFVYKKILVDNTKTLSIHMAPGGGFAMRIIKP